MIHKKSTRRRHQWHSQTAGSNMKATLNQHPVGATPALASTHTGPVVANLNGGHKRMDLIL